MTTADLETEIVRLRGENSVLSHNNAELRQTVATARLDLQRALHACETLRMEVSSVTDRLNAILIRVRS